MTPAERELLIVIAETLYQMSGNWRLSEAVERLRNDDDPPDRRGLSGATVISGPLRSMQDWKPIRVTEEQPKSDEAQTGDVREADRGKDQSR